MKVKTLFLDRIFLFCFFVLFDLLAFCPFVLVFFLLSLCIIACAFFFALGGTFLSCLFGVSPDVFWGVSTQVFQLCDYFFKWYNYLALGLFLLLFGLWGVFFFLFSFANFVQSYLIYLFVRYKLLLKRKP